MFGIDNRCEGNGLGSPAQDISDVGSPTPLLEEAGPDRKEGHIRYTLVDPETLTSSEIASKSGFWMPKKEFEQVRMSIKKGGQAVPVVVRRTPEGAEVIDGRVRVEICKLLKIPVKVTYVEGSDAEMETLSDKLNERRKHITKFQRAAKAAKDYWDTYKDQQRGPGRHGNSPEVREFPTQAAVAESAGVSLSYFELAFRILKREPQKFEEVLSGDISLEKALNSFPPISNVKSRTQSVSSNKSPKGERDNAIGGQYTRIKNDTTDLAVPARSRVSIGSEVESTVPLKPQEEVNASSVRADSPSGDDQDHKGEDDIMVDVNPDLLRHILEYVERAGMTKSKVGRGLLAVAFQLITEGRTWNEKKSFRDYVLNSADNIFKEWKLT